MQEKIKLSEHFTLDEMTFSIEAARRGLMNNADAGVIRNLRLLCEHVLEPLRARFNSPIIVTSGYRSALVNAAAKGAKNSDHLYGLAADIKITGIEPIIICRAIKEMDLPTKQIILEFNSWTHVSYGKGRQCLTAMTNGNNVYYENGFIE